MHTRVENEVHSNTTVIIRLSWQKEEEKEVCCADFFVFLYLEARGKVVMGVSRHYVRPTTSLTASQTDAT